MIRRSTWVVLVIFAALVAVLVFWQRSKENSPEEPTPTPEQPSLLDLNTDITYLRLEKVGGAMVEMELGEDGLWKLTWPLAEKTDVGAVQSAVTQLLSLRILTTLDTIPGLDTIGLASPTYRILIGLDDGSQVIINVGDSTPTGSGYYVLVSGRPLYVINKSGLDSVLKLIDTPPIEPTPTTNPETTPTIEGESTPVSTP
jgi:hypothetical protein